MREGTLPRDDRYAEWSSPLRMESVVALRARAIESESLAGTGAAGRTPAEAYRGETPVDMMDKPLRALPTSPQAQQQQDRFKGIPAA